jgi:hypothetical protein
MPSTFRRRVESVKDTSEWKTEQSKCAHPWPSVGLHARKYESGRGIISFILKNRRGRAQSKQSGIYRDP